MVALSQATSRSNDLLDASKCYGRQTLRRVRHCITPHAQYIIIFNNTTCDVVEHCPPRPCGKGNRGEQVVGDLLCRCGDRGDERAVLRHIPDSRGGAGLEGLSLGGVLIQDPIPADDDGSDQTARRIGSVGGEPKAHLRRVSSRTHLAVDDLAGPDFGDHNLGDGRATDDLYLPFSSDDVRHCGPRA